MQYYPAFSWRKQALFFNPIVIIIYILRKNFKQISFIYWKDFNFFSVRKDHPGNRINRIQKEKVFAKFYMRFA